MLLGVDPKRLLPLRRKAGAICLAGRGAYFAITVNGVNGGPVDFGIPLVVVKYLHVQ